MKSLKIICLFLACRLGWTWLDQCGSDLGLGESLPFCLDCSGWTTTIRLLLLFAGAYFIYHTLRIDPEDTRLREDDAPLGRTYLIHWHRIVILLSILTYPIWVSWVDSNTFIPGPDALSMTKPICQYERVKGTMIWTLVVGFATLGFRILHRS